MEANPDAQDLAQQLAEAARDGDDARVATLIDIGASCDATHDLGDPKGVGRSAVYWAARGGHLRIFHLLKSAGADIHAPADNGYTPFMAACRKREFAKLAVRDFLTDSANPSIYFLS